MTHVFGGIGTDINIITRLIDAWLILIMKADTQSNIIII